MRDPKKTTTDSTRRDFLEVSAAAGMVATLPNIGNAEAAEAKHAAKHGKKNEKQLLLLSNGSYHGTALRYAADQIQELFDSKKDAPGEPRKKVLFIPYAKKNYDKYTADMQAALGKPGSQGDLGIDLVPAHKVDPIAALNEVDGVFVGGGNTFRLLDKLQETGLDKAIKEKVEKDHLPYLGSSAGSNVAGPTIKTTNDMPIVQPKTLDAMGLVSFQINPHYVEGKFYYSEEKDNSFAKEFEGKGIYEGLVKKLGKKIVDMLKTLVKLVPYNGETRDARIKEFHEENTTPVVGLREGTMLRVRGNNVQLMGVKHDNSAMLFDHAVISDPHFDDKKDADKYPVKITDGNALSLLMEWHQPQRQQAVR